MQTTDSTPSIPLTTAFVIKSVQVSAFVLLSYDHLLTLGREIRVIWRWPLPKLSLAFIISRYLSLVGVFFQVYPLFGVSAAQICIPVHYVRVVTIIMVQISIWGSQLWRVSALYNHSKTFIYKMLILLVMISAFDIWTFENGEIVSNSPHIGCSAQLTSSSSRWVGIAWIFFCLWEMSIIYLTVIKTWNTARTIREITGQNFLSKILFRDGVIYFLVTAVFYLASSVTYLTNAAFLLQNALAWLSGCISVIMTSHLILNIKEHINSGANIDEDEYHTVDIAMSDIVLPPLENIDLEEGQEETQAHLAPS